MWRLLILKRSDKGSCMGSSWQSYSAASPARACTDGGLYHPLRWHLLVTVSGTCVGVFGLWSEGVQTPPHASMRVANLSAALIRLAQGV